MHTPLPMKIQAEQARERAVFVLLGGLVSLVFLVGIIFSFLKIIKYNNDLNSFSQELSLYSKGERNYPSEERKAFLSKQEEVVNNYLQSVITEPFFMATNFLKQNELSPLEFKEKLFDVKKKLMSSAKEKQIEMCNDIGFLQWEDKLPPKEKMAELERSLFFVEKVASLAIEAGVEKIVQIRLNQEQEKEFSEKSAKDKDYYIEQTAKVVATGKSTAFLDFISLVNSNDMLLTVQAFSVEKKTESKKGKSDSEALYAEVDIVNIYM